MSESIKLELGKDAKTAAVNSVPQSPYLQFPVQKSLRNFFIEKIGLKPTTKVKLMLWTSKSAIRWYWHWMDKYPDLYPKGMTADAPS